MLILECQEPEPDFVFEWNGQNIGELDVLVALENLDILPINSDGVPNEIMQDGGLVFVKTSFHFQTESWSLDLGNLDWNEILSSAKDQVNFGCCVKFQTSKPSESKEMSEQVECSTCNCQSNSHMGDPRF